MQVGFHQNLEAEATEEADAVAFNCLGIIFDPDTAACGLSDLPDARSHCKRSLNAYTGDNYRSQSHSQYLVQCKRAKQAERKLQDKDKSTVAIESAWNAGRVRVGDHVGAHPDADGERKPHPNQWPMQGVMTSAWRQVGSVKTLRTGVDAMSRELAVLSTVASAALDAHKDYVDNKLASFRRRRLSLAINLFYDASPRLVHFGRLQSALMPHARYPFYKDGRWHCLKLEDFLKVRPNHAVLTKGVLDVMASGASVWAIEEDGHQDAFKYLAAPIFISDSGASTILSCLDSQMPQFSSDGIKARHRSNRARQYPSIQ